VIIQSTPENKAEKDSEDNLSLEGDGFDTVIRAKQAVEAECPNTVSCADILTIAARDVLALVSGFWFLISTFCVVFGLNFLTNIS
jgi:peroxidase